MPSRDPYTGCGHLEVVCERSWSALYCLQQEWTSNFRYSSTNATGSRYDHSCWDKHTSVLTGKELKNRCSFWKQRKRTFDMKHSSADVQATTAGQIGHKQVWQEKRASKPVASFRRHATETCFFSIKPPFSTTSHTGQRHESSKHFVEYCLYFNLWF